ncbi:hypothetical protein HanIR_Chr12g0615371 [Helianthus annuus]|nr:hypothetical protein HanIR_Chr12g0615371 [Helianthus annuus]
MFQICDQEFEMYADDADDELNREKPGDNFYGGNKSQTTILAG